MYIANSRATTKKRKKGNTNANEGRKYNHIKCSSKTRVGMKRMGEKERRERGREREKEKRGKEERKERKNSP